MFYVYASVNCEVKVLKMPKGQWNAIVYYTQCVKHTLVCNAIGCGHRACFMPKGVWFCGTAVLCDNYTGTYPTIMLNSVMIVLALT